MSAKRYRKRQVEVEAVQWTGENGAEVAEFLGYPSDDWQAEDGVLTVSNFYRMLQGSYVVRHSDTNEPFSASRFQATYEPVEGEGDGHRIEIEFDGFLPSVRLVHPEHGCPQGEEGEGCWLTDWLENEGVELLRGKLTLPVRWEAPADRDHPLFHVLGASPQSKGTDHD